MFLLKNHKVINKKMNYKLLVWKNCEFILSAHFVDVKVVFHTGHK